MDKRLKEILARKQEIRTMLQGDEDINVKEIQDELRELEAEETKIQERREIADGITAGTIETRTIEKPKVEKKSEVREMRWNEAIETEEYRSAWIKETMDISLSDEERSLMDKVNSEYRDFTHTTENSAILIPKTVATGIWKRAEEQYPLWNDVRKLRVKGELSMIKSDGNAIDAKWYTEDETVDTDKLGFGQLNLTGCELSKAIQVSWKLRKMAINEFEAYIIREIGDRMGASLSKAVYEGKGKPGSGDTFKPEPYGIKTRLSAQADTPQIKEYDPAKGIEYKNLTASRGAIHSSYSTGLVIYANSTTVWDFLANIVDTTGRPLFMTDIINGDGVGRILGKTVKEDATIPDGELLFGNLGSGYLANINEDITMYREEHVRQRLTDYMGYAIVDGDVQDEKAFVILQATTVAG